MFSWTEIERIYFLFVICSFCTIKLINIDYFGFHSLFKTPLLILLALGPSSMAESDVAPPNSGISDVALILDTSVFAAEDDLYQQQFVAALILQLDIW